MNKQRIVSCAPSTTEILMLLGLQPQVVGVDDTSMQLGLCSSAESLGAVDNINVLLAASLNPDLVIVSDNIPGMEIVIDYMQDEQLPLLVLHTERFDDLLSDIYTIGAECGVEERAREVVEQLHQQVRRLNALVRATDEPLRAYFEWWPNPFVSAGKQSWVSDMLKRAGASNIFLDYHEPTFVIEDEQEIIERDPEVIFVCWPGTGDDLTDLDPDQILTRKAWKEVTGIRMKQVYFLPETLFAFPGPRMLEGLELLIDLLSQCQRLN